MVAFSAIFFSRANILLSKVGYTHVDHGRLFDFIYQIHNFIKRQKSDQPV